MSEEASDTLRRFSFTSKQTTAKSLQLLPDSIIKAHRKDITYNEADINLLLDEHYEFNIDHLYDSLDVADDRQFMPTTDTIMEMSMYITINSIFCIIQ